MKKFNLSLVAVVAMSTFAIAGGDIAPIIDPVIDEPTVEAPVVPSIGSFYLGLAYSYMNVNKQEIGGPVEIDTSGNAYTLLAGYNINPYFAIEGRYSATVGDLNVDNGTTDTDVDADLSNMGLYIKPMYPITNFNLYALLGYGEVELEDETESGFQWGLGASYSVNENIAVFTDYTRLYDDSDDGADVVVDAFTVGLNYKF